MSFDILSNQKPQIHISESDMKRLRNLAFAAISTPDIADELLNELERAYIISDAEQGAYIGIGSHASFSTQAGQERKVQLVLPGDADISKGKISILTPVGVALLGLSKGQSMKWTARDGRVETLQIISIG